MDELKLLISGIVLVNEEKKACVRFEDSTRFAEGYIPDCKINSQSGFSDEEISLLEDYMKENLGKIKRLAAEVDPILSMVREEKNEEDK